MLKNALSFLGIWIFKHLTVPGLKNLINTPAVLVGVVGTTIHLMDWILAAGNPY